MKTWVVITIFIVLVGAPEALVARMKVVATTPDIGAIAKAVGGEHVEVKSIARGFQDPHQIAAKPSYMRLLNRANLLVYTGLELEVGWLPLLISGARNPAIRPGAVGHLDASRSVQILEVPEGQVDRSAGDVHPEGNPHYMLDPRNGILVARAIAEKLGELDPSHRLAYEKNLASFRKSMMNRIHEWETRLSGLKGRKVVTYHRHWSYFVQWLGLIVVDQVENKPGIPPSPRHIADLTSLMISEQIRILVCSNYVAPKPPRRLAEMTGARLLLLPISVGGEPKVKRYQDLFEVVVSQLEPLDRESQP